MKTVEDYEKIRREYFIEGTSIRGINRKYGYSREIIRKAIAKPAPEPYKLKQPRKAPVLGAYKKRIKEMLDESDRMPRKQRYTAHKIYELLKAEEEYTGSESSVHNFVSQQRKKRKIRKAYLPLEFDPGEDAQADWGEAFVIMRGKTEKVNLFIMRLNYSRVRFVMAFPFQRQEAFFEGHIQAFHFFGGIPRRITYDNLKTAVFRVLKGKNRQEQKTFITFRSYYLFKSYYCNPQQGHEKGGVENDTGYSQRNFMTPMLEVESYQELNEILWNRCLQDVKRNIRGKQAPIEELWEEEKPYLLPLVPADFAACTTHLVKPNNYSQVQFETNRYSVPETYRNSQLVLQAYPFRVKILCNQEVIADHPRCLDREQDIIEPMHYLSLLEKRPGAFDHAIPIRRWRKKWAKEYELLLYQLRDRMPDGRGVREFIAILKLHQEYPTKLIEQAIKMALELGSTSLDGVLMCIRRIQECDNSLPSLDLSHHPLLAQIGNQPLDLQQYNQLLNEGM
jgi:transposase